MPRSWIPEWVLRKVGSPCFKLHKTLYGHPQAGNLLGGKPVQSVARKGLMSIPWHPSTRRKGICFSGFRQDGNNDES
eukprot:5048594-Amphidinium_carterae.1